jgi:AraC-like DNA-binding protein
METVTTALADDAILMPRDIHCRLLHSNFITITPETWAHSLCNPYWRLYQNLDDGASVITPNGEYALPAQRIVLIPAWGKFKSRCVRPVRHFYIHFDPHGLDGDWEREHFTHPIILSADTELEQLALSLHAPDEQSLLWRSRVQHLLLTSLIKTLALLPGDVIRNLDDSVANRDPLRPALRFIESNLHDKLHITQLANLCDLSIDHFCRLFRQLLDQTPMRYIQERRITIAAERLVSTNDDISLIASHLGFANRYHFTRVFTQHMGVPPATYRRTGRM